MDKIFKEHDWDSNDGTNETSFSFAKQKVTKKKQKKEPKAKQNADSFEPGRFVRAPPPAENGESKSRKRKPTESVQELHNNDSELKKSKRKKSKGSTNGAATPAKNHDVSPKKPPVETAQTAGKPISFRDKLVGNLKGSRFRFLNEQLYKTTGGDAQKLFQQDPTAFEAYHEGYRHQIVQWSMNPLERIIKSIQKMPEDKIIADFGCGEARLAESVRHRVYSLDLVAANESVIACDMANTPLESNSVHVAVFCLSLMGTNLRDFLLEANRVLKNGGSLKIAEVTSRFDNVKEFVDCVQKCGFLLENKDLKHKLFYFFNFKKVRTMDKTSLKGKHFSLKPCLYKKR